MPHFLACLRIKSEGGVPKFRRVIITLYGVKQKKLKFFVKQRETPNLAWFFNLWTDFAYQVRPKLKLDL